MIEMDLTMLVMPEYTRKSMDHGLKWEKILMMRLLEMNQQRALT